MTSEQRLRIDELLAAAGLSGASAAEKVAYLNESRLIDAVWPVDNTTGAKLTEFLRGPIEAAITAGAQVAAKWVPVATTIIPTIDGAAIIPKDSQRFGLYLASMIEDGLTTQAAVNALFTEFGPRLTSVAAWVTGSDVTEGEL